MANDLVFNMIANSSQFTAGMKQAQKAADSLFFSTATGAEKFAVELENLQRIAHLTNMDQGLFNRAYDKLNQAYDPFGAKARAKEAEDAATAEKQIATDKTAYIQSVIERSKQMEWGHKQQLHQATLKQDAAEVQSAKARTASILAAERAAAQTRITQIANVEAFRERLAEQSGRALLRDARTGMIGIGPGGANRGMIVQQLTFAAEDAATQMGTRGLAGALMAAGNNLTFAASMANPFLGTLASVGLTGALVASVMYKMSDGAKKAAKDVDDAAESNKRFAASFEAYQRNRDALQGIDSLGKGQAVLKGFRDREESLNAQMRRSADMRVMAQEESAAVQKQLKEREEKLEMLRNINQKMFFIGSQMMFAADMVATSKNSADQEKLLEIGKRYNDALAEQSRIQNELASIARDRAEAETRTSNAARMRWQEEMDGANMRAEFDDWSKAWDESQQILEKMKTPQDRFADSVNRINKLKERGLFTDEESARAIRNAREEMEKAEQTKQRSGNLLTGAMDIKSAEAFGVMANAQARAAIGGGPGSSQPAPPNAVDKEIEKNGAKAVATLEKLLQEFGRRPSIPVVGLN